MTEKDPVRANFWDESTGHCDCCGNQSKTIWGDLADSTGTKALYFVQWTVDHPEHMPNFDIVLGPWGEGTTANDRVLVSLLYKPRLGGGAFMVGSGNGRRADDRNICRCALQRTDVIGTPLANEVFSLVDALWLTEPRIEEIRALDSIVQSQTSRSASGRFLPFVTVCDFLDLMTCYAKLDGRLRPRAVFQGAEFPLSE